MATTARVVAERGPPLLDALFVPFPPVLPGLALAVKLRVPGLLRFGRFSLLPVRRLIEEELTAREPCCWRAALCTRT